MLSPDESIMITYKAAFEQTAIDQSLKDNLPIAARKHRVEGARLPEIATCDEMSSEKRFFSGFCA